MSTGCFCVEAEGERGGEGGREEGGEMATNNGESLEMPMSVCVCMKP